MCSSALCSVATLEGQQGLFDVQSAGVADQFARAANDSVARDDDSQGILAVGRTHGSRCLRFAELTRQGAIGRGLAVWNVLQGTPHRC